MAEPNTAPKNFGFGEDEAMLRDLARRFLDEKLPVEMLRRLVAEAPEPIYDEGLRPVSSVFFLKWSSSSSTVSGITTSCSSKRWIDTLCPLRWSRRFPQRLCFARRVARSRNPYSRESLRAVRRRSRSRASAEAGIRASRRFLHGRKATAWFWKVASASRMMVV